MKVSYSINDLLCFRHECVFYGVDVLDILPLRLYQQILLDELPYRYTRASDCPKSSRLHGKLRLIPPSSYIVKINGEVRRDTVVYLCAQMYEGADDDGMGEYANSYCADSVGKVGYNETGYGTTGTPDPELFQSLPSLYEELQVDLLTWRSLVSTALVDFYGLVGQARHFDILTHEMTRPGLQSIIRIQKEDVDVFCTSINNYSFGLGDYFGSKYTMNGRVVVAEQLAFLGMVSPMAAR
ncbi:CIC11C00000003257 [Sungouiella intermedia]|uniref:CIC11C00000003257 n=1 Tax=Sungouiella intermedia TaxID=45354 RepID=A0A1L0BJ00_9ASCO|nr:CIC11C00000003257 [[Candida] intermedia]